MDEQERQVLTAKLAKVQRDWERLNVVRDYLRAELGLGDESTEPGPAEPVQSSSGDVTVNPGEFFATSATKAARSVLERAGKQRPLKTGEIFQAITKGGVKLSSEAVLYRSLTRDGGFLKVGRGVWGLSEWYPASARKAKAEAESVPPEEHDESEAGDNPVPQVPMNGTEPVEVGSTPQV